jgi:hypothetical protein
MTAGPSPVNRAWRGGERDLVIRSSRVRGLAKVSNSNGRSPWVVTNDLDMDSIRCLGQRFR